MSSKKDKLIEEAQRFALRGQIDKAIKAYEQVVSADPSAINQRQKLAELYVKAGRAENAKSEFGAIGKYFSSNGYYLKAIAVYKKMQVMFPGDITFSLLLADLNEKHGLTANALAEYKQVFDYYEKNGENDKALSILEKMYAADSQNIGIQLKLAEAYFLADKKDESYALFGRLASLLHKRGDGAGFNKLKNRIQQLFPEKTEFLLELLTEQVRGDAASTLSAMAGVQELLRDHPEDKRVWTLMVEVYQRLAQPQRVKLAYQHFIKFFPDDVSVQKGLIDCFIADRDLTGALELLDQYEQSFIDGSAFSELRSLYQGLDQIDPVNDRVLQGLQRACELCGDEESAVTVRHRIDSLRTFTGKQVLPPEAALADFESEPHSAPWVGETFSHEDTDIIENIPDESPVDAEGHEEQVGSFFADRDEVEIEIEIEDDITSPFASLPQENTGDEVGESSWRDSVDDVFDFSATSQGSVKFGEDVDISDAQSHYDLGVAFMEMGLYDAAINEFRQAAEDPARKVSCQILQGTCLRGMGNLELAENLIRSLLKSDLGKEDLCSAKYELALACEAGGKSSEAAGLLAEIDAIHPGFRDVRSRLANSGEELALDFSDEELKNFDL